MSDVCEIIIYTISAALSFNVKATTEDFQERLAGALEEGTVILDTVEGSKLILNAINVVAIELPGQAQTVGENSTQPPLKFLRGFSMNRL